MTQARPILRALISVSDKTGIVDFSRQLVAKGIEILSTGGTAQLLKNEGIDVTEVSEHTQFPEMMDGRIKTLHPMIHGGILGRRDQDQTIMATHNIKPIDLVVVNLYPFAQTIANEGCTLADAIENIDIGGPTMIRAAAKNHHDVTVVVDHTHYQTVLDELEQHQGKVCADTRFDLAVRAFEHTAAYDATIANYLGKQIEQHKSGTENQGIFPRTFTKQFIKKQSLRYGENAHQQAAFYLDPHCNEACVSSATQLQGKALSYNNIADTDSALECVKSFAEPACVIVKHANPCGVAVSNRLLSAYDMAYKTDPTSAFGGIIAFNRELDGPTAQAIIERQFVEVIIAPQVSDEALAILATKQNVRVLACGDWQQRAPALDIKQVNGGVLLQERDQYDVQLNEFTLVSRRQPSEQELQDALFCWKVAKFVKSNAIVYAKNNRTIGIGAGQMSRVYSAKIAGIKAEDEQLDVTGSAMASDAFFPFRDGIDAAASAGIRCVIQPGGSIRDEEIIQAANEHDMVMIFTGIRHFRH